MSPRFEASFPPKGTSVYAQEGTAAHALASQCLSEMSYANDHLHEMIEGFEVSHEMTDAVQVYIDLCLQYAAMDGAVWYVERKFNLDSIGPPVPMFGTADFICYIPSLRLLIVIDLKYGRGIAVMAEGNPQLKYYALGAMLAFPDQQIDKIETIIVQPRARGDAVKRATYDSVEILGWSVDLIAKANETLGPNAKFEPGTHCKFCAGDGRCPAQAKTALAAAQIEFDDAVDFAVTLQAPDPKLMTPAQIGALLEKAEVLDTFIGGLRSAAQRAIEAGEDIPGWKLVPTRATRKWIDGEGAPVALTAVGVPAAALYTQKLISPAQAEEQLITVLRAGGMKAGVAKEAAKKTLAPIITAISSGTTLAPNSDTRPTLPSRGSEFDFDQPATRPALPGRGTELDFEKHLPA